MTIAVCDDNRIFLEDIRNRIENILKAEETACDIVLFDSSPALLEAVRTTRFDIVFLDIDMPTLDGKQLARELRATAKNRFKLVFVSDYADEVFSTFQYDIESFIPKNKLSDYLADEIKRIIEIVRKGNRASYAFRFSEELKDNTGRVFIDEIMFVETLNGEIFLHTTDKRYRMIERTFEKLKEEFLSYGFLDNHRTCFVNVMYISCVKTDYIMLKNGTKLPLSRRKKRDIDNALFEYVKGGVK